MWLPCEASDSLLIPERRESSQRRAKERSNALLQHHHQYQHLQAGRMYPGHEEGDDFIDSDDDPAWTPQPKVAQSDSNSLSHIFSKSI